MSSIRFVLILLTAIAVMSSTAFAQQCTPTLQENLDSCAIGALQDCYGSVGGNCEQRYATTDNSVGRFKEICCCKGQQVASKSSYAACKAKTVAALGDLGAILGNFAKRTRANIKALTYSTCSGFPCDEF